MKPDDFTATYGPLAEDISQETGLAPHAILGIVAQETGFGNHFIGNNIFGISPSGPRGQYVAQYPSIQDASRAFVDLIKSRYQDASAGATPEDQVRLISARGYNTNPAYPGAVSQRIATLKGNEQQMASDDDLMQRIKRLRQPAPEAATGGTGAAAAPASPDAGTPSDDALLARIRAIAPSPPPAAKQAATTTTVAPNVNAGPISSPGSVDEYGQPISPLAAAPTPPSSLEDLRSQIQTGETNVLHRLASGPETGPVEDFARHAAGTGVALLSQAAQLPVNILMGITGGASTRNLTINPDTGTLNLTPEALVAAQALAGPGAAGRDLRFVPRGGNPLEFVPPARSGGPLPPETAGNLLSPDARVRAAETPAGPASPTGIEPPPPVPVPTPAAGAVQPAGAQVTTEPIPPKTQTERVRDLEKAVNQTAEDRAGPQMRDDTAYVPGIPPRLLAGRDFSTSVNALDEKVAVAQDRGFRDAVDKNNRSRNEGMVDLLRGDAKDATALDAAHDARSQVSPAEMKVFENEQPTDASGILSKIDKYLSGPEGKQKAVRNTLTDVRASLFDDGGNLEALPSRLYGARKNLTDLLKKGVKGTGDVADDVRASKHILENILPDLDQTITSGAPRFTEYLKAWSDMSKPIDQLEFLQQYQTGPKKLTNDAGYLQPGKVQKMLDDIHQANKARGVNKGKSLTDEQIANIEAVRNELAAQQLQDRLASVRGSDTFQQLNNALQNRSGAFSGLAKDAVIHTLLAPTAGIGNLVYEKGAKPWMAARRARQAAEAAVARRAELLSPPSNPLQP